MNENKPFQPSGGSFVTTKEFTPSYGYSRSKEPFVLLPQFPQLSKVLKKDKKVKPSY